MIHSCLYNCSISESLEFFFSFLARRAYLRSIIPVRLKCGFWLGYSIINYLIIFEPFRSGLTGVLWIFFLLHNFDVLSVELKVANWWPDIILQYFLEENRIHGSKSISSWGSDTDPDHHTTAIMFHSKLPCSYLKIFESFTPDEHLPWIH